MREMAFPYAGRAAQQQVFVPGDEGARRQVLNERAVDAGRGSEVETA